MYQLFRESRRTTGVLYLEENYRLPAVQTRITCRAKQSTYHCHGKESNLLVIEIASLEDAWRVHAEC